MSKQMRRYNVTEFINERGSVSFDELQRYFPSVSDMTLRTDLKELAERGEIIRVRGGARSINTSTHASDLYFRRLQRNVDKKDQIAQKAEHYLREQLDKNPNLSIYLGSGSTITDIANHFPDEWCTVFTSSISCAYALSALKKPTVTVCGGTLNRFNCCCDSPLNLAYLERINFDIMFLAVAGYSDVEGFTCVKEIMDETLGSIIKRSKKIIVPIDSTKIGVAYPITHATLDDVDMIISDDGIPEKTRQHFIDIGIQVL